MWTANILFWRPGRTETAHPTCYYGYLQCSLTSDGTAEYSVDSEFLSGLLTTLHLSAPCCGSDPGLCVVTWAAQVENAPAGPTLLVCVLVCIELPSLLWKTELSWRFGHDLTAEQTVRGNLKPNSFLHVRHFFLVLLGLRHCKLNDDRMNISGWTAPLNDHDWHATALFSGAADMKWSLDNVTLEMNDWYKVKNEGTQCLKWGGICFPCDQ